MTATVPRSGPRPVTGVRTDLVRGRFTATVGQVGAVLRGFTADGVALTESWSDDRPTPMGCGIVLVPWPNRVRQGRWELDGRVQQLDLTDPGHGGAIHGLLRNHPYELSVVEPDRVTLRASIYPQHGYPFTLDTSVTYALTDEGLTVTHEISNVGAAAAPVGLGSHPYLRVGDTPVDDLVLTVPAATEIVVDDTLVPVESRPVVPEHDLRGGARIGDVTLDTCLTDLTRTGGEVRCRLEDPSGRGVELWAGEAYGFLQVFTPRNFPDPAGVRTAVAVEPMTCGPNALNTGEGLRHLGVGQTWTTQWGLRPV